MKSSVLFLTRFVFPATPMKAKKIEAFRRGWDSNPCVQSTLNKQSNALTTRPPRLIVFDKVCVSGRGYVAVKCKL